jgi:hypothetical protein
MKLTKAHLTGLGLTVPSLLGGLATVLTFVTQHVKATADTVCVSGLPPTLVALVAGVATLAGTVGSYILLISPSAKSASGGGGSGSGGAPDSDVTLPGGRIPSGPPERNVNSAGLQRRGLAFSILGGLLAMPFVGIMLLSGSGCTPAQWQNFVTAVTAFLQYVQVFLTGAEAVWQVIVPLIAVADQPKAQAAFQGALQTCIDTDAALQDALNAGTAYSQSDIVGLVANVKAACAELVKIVQIWSGPPVSPDGGAPQPSGSARSVAINARVTRLQAMCDKIYGWRLQ